MSNGESLQALKDEFELLRTDQDYEAWQPLFEQLEPLVHFATISESEQDRDRAKMLMEVVRRLQAAREQGGNVRAQIDSIQGGYVQPDWLVAGDVQQANRDVVNKTIIQVFQQVGDQLQLAPASPTIDVPIVVVAMTENEAEQLKNREVFENQLPVLEEHFDDLEKHLDQACPEWYKRYDEKAKLWRPFGDDDTVEKLVQQSLDIASNNPEYPYPRPLAPDFKDVRNLSKDWMKLSHMRKKGCIIILDIISMRHPHLQHFFHHSLLDAYHLTSVVSIAPTATAYDMARDLAIILQLKLADMEFWRRQGDPFDYGAIEKIRDNNDRPNFSPWLSTRVMKIDLGEKSQGGAPGFREVQR